MRFKPLRTLLGVEAFGIAVWVGDAGEQVVSEHTEEDNGQEEVYVVLSGSAEFTIGDDRVAADLGTCVSVRPDVRRSAHATAPGTAIMAVGAPLGKPYSASRWEQVAAAAPAYRSGDYASAADILAGLLEGNPDSFGILYNLGCCEALLGHRDEALAHVARAVELLPRLRAHAQADPDLDSIRSDPRFPAPED